MNGQLIAEEGILKGLILPLEGGEEWVIGRDPEVCQLLLEDPAASRRHLLCRSTPLGITLENLSSTNPVQVNDQELIGSHLLHEGDAIRIGSGLYRFISIPEQKPALQENEHADTPQIEEEKIEEESLEEHDSILEEDLEAIAKYKPTEINFNTLESGRWLLKVISGPNNGAEFSMHEGESYLIGTDPNLCDIVFHDTSVSRQHARLFVEEDGSVSIEDQGSRNGIFVDGEAAKEKTPLPLNTVVNLGTSSFVIYDREGNMQTIISPLLPSIVKVLQKSPEVENEEKQDPAPSAPTQSLPLQVEAPPKKNP